ncbi:MAG: CcmD family protein [Chlamydiae bacterium]|nr:CcmD family protein [Chlamydiota bacterium]
MNYLVIAFSVVWSGLFFYLIGLFQRQKKIQEELKQLKKNS